MASSITDFYARLARAGERLAQRVESTESLDRAADVASTVLRRVIRPGAVEDTLSGVAAGHPAHPAVVAVPIGAWLAVSVLDAVGADAAAISTVQALGIAAAVPAAATGASDWLSTAGPERRVGLVHALSNYAGLSLHVASWVARRRGTARAGARLALAGNLVVGVGGWLGGHLSYALGVGVDTTAFQQFPEEWTDVAAETDVRAGALLRVEGGAVPLLLTRADGRIVAYGDRCTHRGGPLDEGEIVDGCVVCPWHGAAFDLRDGTVRSGPATRPQPALDVRVVAGRVEVRREETRTLRINPAGH